MTTEEKDILITELYGIRARQGTQLEQQTRAFDVSIRLAREQYNGKLVFAGLFVISLIVNIILLVI
tara:strand:+ start:809 stop:1006 length:198 start_codon:yes stop_codon:yes gene_type:complete